MSHVRFQRGRILHFGSLDACSCQFRFLSCLKCVIFCLSLTLIAVLNQACQLGQQQQVFHATFQLTQNDLSQSLFFLIQFFIRPYQPFEALEDSSQASSRSKLARPSERLTSQTPQKNGSETHQLKSSQLLLLIFKVPIQCKW